MKKHYGLCIAIASALAVLIVLVTPVRRTLEDGGTVEYRAILYRYTKYNTIAMCTTDRTGATSTCP